MDSKKPIAGTTENNQELNPEANPEPKSGNLPLRVGVVFAVFFLAASAGMTALTLGGGPAFLTPAVRQPLAFNHLKHVKDLDLACNTCHVTVETEAFSGLPSAEICAGCHAEAQGTTAEEKRLVKMIQDGTPLAWVSLFRQPPHVFYSHRRHVVVAKIPCTECHGGIAETTSPPLRVRKLQMKDCLACHERKRVSTDCTACHR